MTAVLFGTAKALLLLAGMFAAWLAVQRAYQRSFPEEGDLDSVRLHGMSPSYGTPLDPMLRSLGVSTVIARTPGWVTSFWNSASVSIAAKPFSTLRYL